MTVLQGNGTQVTSVCPCVTDLVHASAPASGPAVAIHQEVKRWDVDGTRKPRR
jgi:hypothetical protein